MLKTTHINFGLFNFFIVLLLFQNYLNYGLVLSFFLLPILLLLPDIDHKDGILNNKFFFLKYIYKKIFDDKIKHRGFTHQLNGIIIFSIVIFIFFNIIFGFAFFNIYEFLGIFIGIFLHVLGDLFTKGNIQFLYPLNKISFISKIEDKINNFRTEKLFVTGSDIEKKYIMGILIILNLIIFFYYFIYKNYLIIYINNIKVNYNIIILVILNIISLISLIIIFTINKKKSH